MREVRHENLVPFLGACVDTGSVFILTPYFSRGNLSDVLGNEDYRIDNMFTASLVADLIKVGGFAPSTNQQIVRRCHFAASCFVRSKRL